MEASVAPAGSGREEAGRLLRLAWPVVLGQVGLVAMGFVDLIAVRTLGEDATAAVGIGNTLSYATLILALGAGAGLDPLVAQAFGRGEPRVAGAWAARGLVVSLLLCVPITAIHLLAEPVLVALRQPPSAIPDAVLFCRILATAVVPFAAFAVLRSLLQGGGSMRPAMWVILVANLVNFVAAFGLVQGWGPLPALGVAGVAWATAVVRWLMLFGLVAVGWEPLRRAWPAAGALDPRGLAAVAAIALPVAFQLGLEVWAFNAAAFVSGTFGSTAAAAHTATISAASMSFMVPLGLSAAAATRIGNLVGAGLPWTRSAALSLAMGFGVMTASATAFLCVPGAIGRLYNPDPGVVAMVVTILPVAGAFQWFDGTQVVGFGVLRGLGDTRVPVAFNVVAYWVVGLPVGFALASWAGLGVLGVWLGLTVGLALVAGLLLVRIASHARAAGGSQGGAPWS